MAKKGGKDRHRFLAKLVTGKRSPCAFCQRVVDDETTFGKLYAIGDIQCHYFCVLLSCCLVQKGKDEDGLFGFLYPDILAEVERSKKHKCSFCNKDGATLGCSVTQCRKQFHLPCGREKNAVSLFYGNYKSFCQIHAPKQKIPDNIMSKARVRMQEKRKVSKNVNNKEVEKINDLSESLSAECVCVICYEEVDAFPTLQTFWPPCCARDAWFHRSCLQRMALSAGMHYLKCPLCNDKENFYQAVIGQGYYVPDRDAAWELEQNAFAEIYERPLVCSVEDCKCPLGRDHDSDAGLWDMLSCLLCGSAGAHAQCATTAGGNETNTNSDGDMPANGVTNGGGDMATNGGGDTPMNNATNCVGDVPANCATRYVCGTCRPAAPRDLDRLHSDIQAVIVSEQARVPNARRGPLMPSRMSLRRTKQRIVYGASSSSHTNTSIEVKTESDPVSKTASSREELNLKKPKRPLKSEREDHIKAEDSSFLSPVKFLEQKLRERKMGGRETENGTIDEILMEQLRRKIMKPRPLSAKRKIIDGILDDILNNAPKEKRKVKEPLKQWNSPKKANNDVNNDLQDQQIITAETTKDSKKTEENNTDELPTTEETTPIDLEDSSNSTFHLPAEFIADHNSDESIPFFETPKKTKTVEIQKNSSMEISENNDKINIDLVKIENVDTATNVPLKTPEKNNFKLKYSPKDKILKNKTVDLDIETFKNQYLNEVDKQFKCNFSHKHDSISASPKLRTAIDFAIDAAKENRKRKLKSKNSSKNSKKKRKSHLVLKYECDAEKKKSNSKTELSITNGNDSMQVKISLKKKKFRLRIMQSQREAPKTMKQYVLKYSPTSSSSKEIIQRPDKEVSPIKRKYVKLEKSPDNLKQLSIHTFFKSKPSNIMK